MKHAEDWHITQCPPGIRVMQYGYKLLMHGKLCPKCKKNIMVYEDMKMFYRIPIPREFERVHPAKVYFAKPNWDYVCNDQCQVACRKEWDASTNARANLLKKCLDYKLPDKERIYAEDSYRTKVYKMCRLDYNLNVNDELFRPDDWRSLVNSFQLYGKPDTSQDEVAKLDKPYRNP